MCIVVRMCEKASCKLTCLRHENAFISFFEGHYLSGIKVYQNVTLKLMLWTLNYQTIVENDLWKPKLLYFCEVKIIGFIFLESSKTEHLGSGEDGFMRSGKQFLILFNPVKFLEWFVLSVQERISK